MAAYKNNLVISTYSGRLYVSHNSGNNFTEINSANVLNEFPSASPVAIDILKYPIVIGTDNSGELFIVNPFYEHFILFSRDFLNNNLTLIELNSDSISSNFTISLARIKNTNTFVAFMAPFNYIVPSQYSTPLLFEFELPESGKTDARVTGK